MAKFKVFSANGIKTLQDTGSLYKETEYENNYKHGICKTYYVSGNLWNQYYFVRNCIDGVAVWYNDTMGDEKYGNLWYYCTYVNGIREGLCERYYNHGSIFKQVSYVKNEKHGLCRVWDENGKESVLKEYEHGVKKKTYILNTFAITSFQAVQLPIDKPGS
jgi:antitoxin component YwqK of YwqJK toxin-antitoxin module